MPHTFVLLQLPCGPAPRHRARNGRLRVHSWKICGGTPRKLFRNHHTLRPGGVPEALGGRLGTTLAPRGAPSVCQGRQDTKKVENGNLRNPPHGPSWETKFEHFVAFVGLFSYRFLIVVLGGLRLQFEVDLGRSLGRFLIIF